MFFPTVQYFGDLQAVLAGRQQGDCGGGGDSSALSGTGESGGGTAGAGWHAYVHTYVNTQPYQFGLG